MPTLINRPQKKDKDISVVDSTDVKILNALQANARISNAELADLVNLSQTPCLRRLRKLEKSGLIQHYTTCLDHSMLGINVSAFVFIKLNKNTSAKAAEFEAAINQFPEILECCVLAGVHDYALRIVTKNLQTFESFLKDKLANVEQVENIESTIILNQTIARHSPQLSQN
jgi:DNA-binding Lrp family transcriptional regulator